MPTCEYRHPLRTIVLTYRLQAGLLSLEEYHETATVDSATPSGADVVVHHGDAVATHSYPVLTDNAERRIFELDHFLQEVTSLEHHIVAIESRGTYQGSAWTTLMGVDKCGRHNVSDIEGILATARLDEPTVYVGRSGSRWWVLDAGSTVEHVLCIPVSEGASTSHADVLDSVQQMLDFKGRRCTVFGDAVTPQDLVGIQQRVGKQFHVVERFQPFRHVLSKLTAESERRVLSRSHMLGCMVGAMLLHEGLVAPVSVELETA